MKIATRAASALLISTALFAQTPQFEVASIRPATPIQASDQARVNVGLRLDGQQARIISFSLRDYIAMAYKLKTFQVIGPDSLSTRYDIVGTMPAGSKPDQVPEMLQALLAERFQMKLHNEKRDLPVYALGLGKGPLQLKELPPDPAAAASDGGANVAATGSGAGVSVSLGNGSSYTFANNKWEGKKLNLDMLARQLERYTDRPIVNQTGLKGLYDITLEITQEDYLAMLIRVATGAGVVVPPQAMRLLETNTMPSLFDAIDKQGLKLEAKKLPQDVIVIDNVLKAPTEN